MLLLKYKPGLFVSWKIFYPKKVVSGLVKGNLIYLGE